MEKKYLKKRVAKRLPIGYVHYLFEKSFTRLSHSDRAVILSLYLNMLGTCEVVFGVLCPDLSSPVQGGHCQHVLRSDARLIRDWNTRSVREIEGTGFVHPGREAAEGW